MKQDSKIYWIIGAVIIVILLINYYQKPKQEISLKVHYYKDGVEVFPEKSNPLLFSSVITPPGTLYDTISFTISGKNTGNTDLTNITFAKVTPQAFKNALPTTTQTLLKGENKVLWNSASIPVDQFNSLPQPTRFRVNVSVNAGILRSSSIGALDLFISKGGLVIFRTNVKQNVGSSPYTPVFIYIDSQTTGVGDTTDGNQKWIAFDKNNDKIMEKYGPTTATVSNNVYCDSITGMNVLLYMPFGNDCLNSGENTYCSVYILYDSIVNRIAVCYNNRNLGGTMGGSQYRYWTTSGSGAVNAVIANTSISSYSVNEQERYL